MIRTKLVGIQENLTLIKLANPKLLFPSFSFVASPFSDARKKKYSSIWCMVTETYKQAKQCMKTNLQIPMMCEEYKSLKTIESNLSNSPILRRGRPVTQSTNFKILNLDFWKMNLQTLIAHAAQNPKPYTVKIPSQTFWLEVFYIYITFKTNKPTSTASLSLIQH